MDIKDYLLKRQARPKSVPLYNPSLKNDFVYKDIVIPRRGIKSVPVEFKKVVLKKISDMLVNERNIGYVSKEKRKSLYKEIEVEI